VLAFAVVQRTAEIGVRLSLGATRADILRMVLADGGRLVVFGLVIGGALALLIAFQVRAALFGVDPLDPLSLAVVIVLVAGMAFAASIVPALRAAGVSPITALRAE